MRSTDAVISELRASGQTRWTRSEILRVINRLGLRPWRTLDRLTSVGGPLRFVGTCSSDGYFVEPPSPGAEW